MSDAVTILLVDDHAIVRDGCRNLLESANFQVVAEAGSGEEGYALCVNLKPQIVVMDLSMDGWGGLQTIKRIRLHTHMTRVVVLTMHTDGVYATHALAAGALAYITKKSAPGLLIEAVRRAVNGKRCLSPDIAEALALSKVATTEHPLNLLSTREFDILQLLLNGKTVADIAGTVSLSPKSVTNCVIRIKRKLGARTVPDLIRIAIDLGIARQGLALAD
jgi:DNA-binding NarL/FixJ family response regulator